MQNLAWNGWNDVSNNNSSTQIVDLSVWTNPQQPQPQPQILYSQQIQQQPPIQQYEQQQTNWPNTQQMQHQQQQQQQPFLTQSLPQPLLTQQPPPITFQYHQPNSLQQQSHPQQQLQQQVLYQQIPAAIPSNTQSSIDEESALETMDLNATAMSWHSLANPDIKEREDGLASKHMKNKSYQDNNYNIPFIPPEFDSNPYWNQSPSLPSSSPPPTDEDEVNVNDYQTLKGIPRCFDKHERGRCLLTINVVLGKGCSQTIYVHVNDDPADLARDFCDLWKITNPEVVPALEDLIKEERSKILIVK
ncbi:4782_t:CDS:2 [Entrophospora sp. SA101]|nr:4782_t:CDS:2 [Entrophospora sp. SA101]